MSKIHDEILEELKEINTIGAKHLRIRTRELKPVSPVKKYTAEQIKEIREKNGYTQLYLSYIVGASLASVQAWEAGTTEPNGAVKRLIEVIEKNPKVLEELQIINC